MALTPTDLKKQLDSKKLSNLYLLYGDEKYLIDLNIEKIKGLVPDMGFPDFNRFLFDGKTVSFGEITEAVDGFPMMSEQKLVIINDSGAFGTKAKEDIKEFYQNLIRDIKPDTVLVFREYEVDGRSGLFKELSKLGTAVEFKSLKDTDLATWVIREITRHGKKITRVNAEYLISLSDKSLQTLQSEVEKLCSIDGEEISAPLIDRLAVRSAEAKAFELFDLIVSKNTDKTLRCYEDLKKDKKTTAFGLLYLLYSSFEKALKAKLLLKRHEPDSAIASELKTAPFIAKKIIFAAKSFDEKKLIQIVKLVPELDLSIKRGEITDWQAVDKIIFLGLGVEL